LTATIPDPKVLEPRVPSWVIIVKIFTTCIITCSSRGPGDRDSGLDVCVTNHFFVKLQKSRYKGVEGHKTSIKSQKSKQITRGNFLEILPRLVRDVFEIFRDIPDRKLNAARLKRMPNRSALAE
jgi:hypothetical protein